MIKFDISLSPQEAEQMRTIKPECWFTQVAFSNAISPRHPEMDSLDANHNLKTRLVLPWIQSAVKGKRVLDLFCANGAFSFELAPDDYTVSFDADGYQGGTLVQMQQVEEGKETVVKTIRLVKASHRTSLIRGTVFDSAGASLPGVSLKLVRVPTEDEEKDHKKVGSLSLSYTSNSHGEFAFRVPSVRARYRVTATLNGYKLETKVVDVNENESVPLAFSLEPVKK